ncbi:ATP-binding protein [Streptomyces sp. NPDC055078]
MTRIQVRRRWARDPRSPGLARDALRRELMAWGLVEMAPFALTVLSELVTNACVHTTGGIETWFRLLPGGVRIEVLDASAERPLLLAPRADSPGGRGLLIVDELAARWGVTDRRDGGKAVWAELVETGSPAAQEQPGLLPGVREGAAGGAP